MYLPRRRDGKGADVTDSPRKTAAYDFLDSHAKVDEPRMLSLLAPDARMHTTMSARQWGGAPDVISGAETIAAYFTSRHGAHGGPALWKAGSTSWEHDFAVEENDYVVIHTTRRSVTVDDKDYENNYVIIFRFEGSQIADLWEYLDSAYAFSIVPKPEVTTAAFRGE
jgi:ketosteroid isomerase-like protein